MEKFFLFVLIILAFDTLEKHFAININSKLVKAAAVVSLILGVIILLIMIVMFMSVILQG